MAECTSQVAKKSVKPYRRGRLSALNYSTKYGFSDPVRWTKTLGSEIYACLNDMDIRPGDVGDYDINSKAVPFVFYGGWLDENGQAIPGSEKKVDHGMMISQTDLREVLEKFPATGCSRDKFPLARRMSNWLRLQTVRAKLKASLGEEPKKTVRAKMKTVPKVDADLNVDFEPEVVPVATAPESLLPEIFKYDGESVEVVLDGDIPWFVARDLANVLGFRDAASAVRCVDPDDKGAHFVDTPGGKQNLITVNESGLYTLMLRSKKAEAKKFRKWVTAEVLPSIRKKGQYAVDPSKITRLQMAKMVMESEEARLALERKLEEAAPKVEFYDVVAPHPDLMSMAEVAKILNYEGLGRNNLFALLREDGILQSLGQMKNYPYQRYVTQGHFKLVEVHYEQEGEQPCLRRVTMVTNRGLEFINNHIKKHYPNYKRRPLKEDSLLPLEA